jgi:ubiquinone/menaquinone biosynthesis C-methylase UbiE
MAGHPVFAAWYQLIARSIEAGPLGQARRELVSTADGVVVDLGTGIGLNLPHLGPAVSHVHAVEPDPHMVRRLRPALDAFAAGSGGVSVDVHAVGAERLPLPDRSADTVLATLTLCTVRDLQAVAGEIRRVLRPGGRLVVLEHVLSQDPRVAGWQRRLRRPWGWFGGGCSPVRETGEVLSANGFDVSSLRRLTVPGPPVTREWIAGEVRAG